MEWIYDSMFTKEECFDKLLRSKPSLDEELNPFYTDIIQLSDSRLYLVYKGRRFSKARRTEFVVDFTSDEFLPMKTRISVRFNGECLGLSIPMTSVQEMDSFLGEKLSAYRRK